MGTPFGLRSPLSLHRFVWYQNEVVLTPLRARLARRSIYFYYLRERTRARDALPGDQDCIYNLEFDGLEDVRA